MDVNLEFIPKNYPRRPGSDDVGRDYENKMTALLALRCAAMEGTQDMWLASNADQVGDFDDVVLYQQMSEKCISYLIQLKHQENPKNITQGDLTYSTEGKKKAIKSKGDFSLAKYYASFVELKTRLDNPTGDEYDMIRCLRKSDVQLVLFTNRNINKCDLLVNNDSVDFLNTSSIKDSIYKLKPDKFSYNPDFVNQFLLYTNQIHISEVDKAIRTEIKKLIASSKSDNVDYKQVASNFVAFIKAWIKTSEPDQKNNLRKCLVLTKSDIVSKLTDLLLTGFKLNFSNVFYACALKNVWNEIVADKSVTVVAFSEEIVEFLMQFIGSEVCKYCSEVKKTWGDHLSRNAESSLRSCFVNTFKLFDNQETTLYTIYQCLWLSKKVPLLLCIDNRDDYQVIIKILKLSCYELRVIITTHTEVNFKKTAAYKSFVTLNNLNGADSDKILNMHANVQGRSCKLQDLEFKRELVKTKDIVQILSGHFNVGQVYEPLPPYFVQSRLLRTFLKFEVLHEVQDETFFIHAKACDLNKLSVLSNVVIFNDAAIKINRNETMHRLVLHADGLLEWKESLGSIKNIRRYQLVTNIYKSVRLTDKIWESPVYPCTVDLFWDEFMHEVNYFNNTRIVSANPGMGKTTFVDFVATQAPADFWVLKIFLNEHDDYYEKIHKYSTIEHLRYFNDVSLRKYNSNIELSQSVFESLLKSKKILVCCDGFEEIYFSHKDEVTQLVDQLHKDGYCVWLTTRPYTQAYLEERFCTIATTLKPFTKSDQKYFLKNYFGVSNQTIVEAFIDKLLRAAECNLNDNELTGIPLQLQLLANVFSDDLQASIRNNSVSFNDRFNLLHLYEEFIRKKADILCAKYGKGAKEMRILFEKLQKLCALKITLPKRLVLELNITQQLDKYQNEHLFFLQREGIVVVEDDVLSVKFIHSTFAFYFTAKWFVENLDFKNEKLIKAMCIFQNHYYAFVFRMFNFMLAKDCALHTAIVTGQIDEAAQIIEADPNTVDITDAMGRTVLHLLSIHGVNHEEFDLFPVSHVPDKMLDVLKLIPNKKIQNIEDAAGYSPLDYALESHAMAVANAYCEKSQMHLNIKLCGQISSYAYCLALGYQALFMKILLPFFVGWDLLLGNVHKDETIESYCNLNHIPTFHDCNATTILQLVDKNDLRFVASFGTVCKNNKQINEPDCYGNIPLHYAALHGQLENTKVLVAAGADINKLNDKDETPLHLAAQNGHIAIVSELISKVNINKANNCGNTPLLLALKHGHVDVANLLLENGTHVSTETNDKSALLYAAEIGADAIVSHLLAKGAEINKTTSFGETALFLALDKKHASTAKLLLSYGADNTANTFGVSPLHYVAQTGDDDLILDLLSKGANINKQTYAGETPLLWALQAHNASTAKLLLSKGAEQKDECLLHYASEIGDEDIILDMLSKGASINEPNSIGETPLIYALKRNNINIARLLLSKGADVNTKHAYINDCSPLLYAATAGLNEIIPDLLPKADINESNLFGETPLLLALKHSHLSTVQLLLNKADITTKNRYNQTALYYSIRYALLTTDEDIKNQLEIINFLLNNTDVNAQDWEGYTPLHALSCDLAALDNYSQEHEAKYKKFSTDVVSLLLDKGADISLKTKQGETALDLAKHYENGEIILLLQSCSK